MNEKRTLLEAWCDEEIPSLNGVVFLDSTFIPMELYADDKDKYWKTGIRLASKPNIEYSIDSLEHVNWTSRN